MLRFKIITIISLFSTNAFLCSEDETEGSYQDNLDELELLINTEIGNAEASDLAECRSLAFGSKPCGGPWSYLVYSSTDSDESHLLNLVQRYNDVELDLNNFENRGSDCSVPIKPNLALKDMRCVAETP